MAWMGGTDSIKQTEKSMTHAVFSSVCVSLSLSLSFSLVRVRMLPRQKRGDSGQPRSQFLLPFRS